MKTVIGYVVITIGIILLSVDLYQNQGIRSSDTSIQPKSNADGFDDSTSIQKLTLEITKNPQNAALYRERAKFYQYLHRFEEALADLNKAINLQADWLEAYFQRAAVYYKQGNYQQAVKDYTICLDKDPKLLAVYFNRAITWYRLGNIESARDDMNYFIQQCNDPHKKEEAKQLLLQWQQNK